MASQQRQNYRNGEWVGAETTETVQVTNPADGSVVATFPKASPAALNATVEAAVTAQTSWASLPAPDRGAILRDAAHELEQRRDTVAELLTQEEGKALPEATGEVQRAIDILYHYGEKAKSIAGTVKSASGAQTRLRTITEPLGTVGLITPWNYPIAIPAWKAAPALVTGNTVVLKPASEAPTVAHELAACFDRAGMPDGVFNVITGSGADVGGALTAHESVDAISFTGSTAVGQTVGEVARNNGARVQLEMGGKNPAVVMPSANMTDAATIVGEGGFGVTGQACTATSRAIVHQSVYDDFLDALTEYAENIDIGPGLTAEMGPQITATEQEQTLEYIQTGREEGATLTAGGGVPDVDGDGHYVEPTVFSDVTPEMTIAQEEIFGPVIAVIAVESFEEAVTVANDTTYGLSASIITQDLTEANEFIDRVESGVVKVNEKTTGLELHVPFGGTKDSSSETWREQGDAGLEFFTTTKTVYVNY